MNKGIFYQYLFNLLPHPVIKIGWQIYLPIVSFRYRPFPISLLVSCWWRTYPITKHNVDKCQYKLITAYCAREVICQANDLQKVQDYYPPQSREHLMCPSPCSSVHPSVHPSVCPFVVFLHSEKQITVWAYLKTIQGLQSCYISKQNGHFSI